MNREYEWIDHREDGWYYNNIWGTERGPYRWWWLAWLNS